MDSTDQATRVLPASAHRRRPVRTRNGLTLQERRRQRRDALLAAGLDLFGTKGYTSTSVEELCRTAFVSTRNFYEEFENREAVLWTLVYQTLADAYDAVRKAAPTPLLPAAERHEAHPAPGVPAHAEDLHTLRPQIDALVHAFLDDPRRARLVFVECRGMSLIQEYRRRAAQQVFAQLFGEMIEEQGARLIVSEGARGVFALAVVGAFDLVMSDWVLQEERPTVEVLIDSLVEVMYYMGASAIVPAEQPVGCEQPPG